jgi:hypothetical protein
LINARKITQSDTSVFNGILDNDLFLIVFAFIFVFQLIIVQIGGQFIKCVPLTFNQHAVSLIIGLGGIGVSYLVKEIPETWFDNI